MACEAGRRRRSLRIDGSMLGPAPTCTTTRIGAGKSAGKAETRRYRASTPPCEAPIATMRAIRFSWELPNENVWRRLLATEVSDVLALAAPVPHLWRESRRDGQMKTFGWIGKAAAVAALVLSLAACGINTVPRQDEQVKAAWSQVQNEYQRRADLVPNLVATVKGYAQQEKTVLTQVIQ